MRPLVAQINGSLLVILGGFFKGLRLNTMSILNTSTDQLETKETDFGFYGDFNQCIMLKPGKLLFLATTDNDLQIQKDID